MTRTVFCLRYQQEMEGLEAAPMPGANGERVFNEVSKQAWTEWQELQTMCWVCLVVFVLRNCKPC